MTTFYGTENTKGRTVPPTLSDGGRAGGRVRAIVDSYTVTSATHTTNDVIHLGRNKLPKGATITGARLSASGTSAGSGRTASLGYVGAAAAFISAGSVATTGLVLNLNVGAGLGYVMTADAYPMVTLGGGAFAAGAVINVVIEYTID